MQLCNFQLFIEYTFALWVPHIKSGKKLTKNIENSEQRIKKGNIFIKEKKKLLFKIYFKYF